MRKLKSNVPTYTIKTKEMVSFGFSIINLAGVSGKTYDSAVPHRHTFYEIFYFQSGKGRHEVDFQSFPIEADSVHFVSPGQIHRLDPRNVKGFVICFSEDFVSIDAREAFAERFPYYDDPKTPSMKLGKMASAEIKQLIELVVKDLNQNGPTQGNLYRSYLNVILIKLNEWGLTAASKKREPRKNAKVQEFKHLVNRHFVQDKSPSSYAQRLHLSANHLNALCKQQEGKTAIRIIQDRMILEAKRLLYATDMHIKEISYQLGFEDVAYFNRFFKNHSKITPLEYRKEQRST